MRYNATIITNDGENYTGEIYKETEKSIFISVKQNRDVSFNSPWYNEEPNIVPVNVGIPIPKDKIKEVIKN